MAFSLTSPLILKSVFLAVACFFVFLSPLSSADTSNDSSQLITYCVDPNWLPFEAIVDGVHTGISADYLSELSDITGMKFALVHTSSWSESLQHHKDGRCRILSMLNKTPGRDLFLDFSEVYFKSPEVFLTRKDTMFIDGISGLKDLKVAIVANYWYEEILAEPVLEIKRIYAESLEQAILMVSDGRADTVSASLMTAMTVINRHGLSNLHVAGSTGFNNELRIGVRKGDTELLTQLNAGLRRIEKQTDQQIFDRWAVVNLAKTTDYTLLLWSAGILILISVVLLTRTLTLRKHNLVLASKNQALSSLRHQLEVKNTELEHLAHTDALTGANNRHYLDTQLKRMLKACRLNDSELCLILLDIDHFKQINDEYGHDVGDLVLKHLVETILAKIKPEHVLARWGGEEFVLICSNTSLAEAEKLAQCILNQLIDTPFTLVGYSISGGVARYCQPESKEAWFKRADKALYQAKQNGRRRIEAAS